ncbi:MAG: hypothetical protein UY48_C0004G0010 [Candidatus Gottesmanbacteria bacterium GW2011_GWB1_49_7]|uniref:Uncharacterized protein n=1 Tax=Candidatus Gottesmanbacteria bacterium GW2011_GWB1_49_7 TaxID=1618448 RepID=A0A0G1W3K0_9BACT|nr:MAG: hypothetical protein UY48_C0004G0010 [Candidatus Gottesmanbacteria bacterium GW2011_GWB1_49_7]
MFYVSLKNAISFRTKGPVTRTLYTFRKGVRTQVDPADAPYFLSQPNRFEVFEEKTPMASAVRKVQPIDRKTVKELTPPRGPSVQTLKAQGETRLKMYEKNAEFRARLIASRASSPALNAKSPAEALKLAEDPTNLAALG